MVAVQQSRPCHGNMVYTFRKNFLVKTVNDLPSTASAIRKSSTGAEECERTRFMGGATLCALIFNTVDEKDNNAVKRHYNDLFYSE
jgi:hypothetical protein